jgi:hypothetical protein
LLTSLLQIWEATKLFQTPHEFLSATEVVQCFIQKVGNETSARFYRMELYRDGQEITINRLKTAIMLNTTLEDPSKVVSSHFPDSHLYHMSGGGQYNRAQRQEADYTSVVDEHVKRRKTTQEYHKPEKKESKEAPESDGDSSAGEAAVAKPLRSNKRGHRYQRAQGSVRNEGDAASAKSLISNESRAKSQSKPPSFISRSSSTAHWEGSTPACQLVLLVWRASCHHCI